MANLTLSLATISPYPWYTQWLNMDSKNMLLRCERASKETGKESLFGFLKRYQDYLTTNLRFFVLIL
jgi:hypothetical protein